MRYINIILSHIYILTLSNIVMMTCLIFIVPSKKNNFIALKKQRFDMLHLQSFKFSYVKQYLVLNKKI